MISDGTAPRIIQPEEGATYDAMLKKNLVQVLYTALIWSAKDFALQTC